MTTPFDVDAVTYRGQAPVDDPKWRVGAHRFWLGRPDTMMIELPSPDPAAYAADPGLGEVEHGLYGGATGVTRFQSTARRWTLSWPRLAGRDWNVVWGFYRRLFGAGPWAFVPPEDVNRLTLAQSMCGALSGAVEGWLATSGTLAYQAATAAPVFPGGVMRWTTPSVGAVLAAGAAGATAGVPDVNHAPPYIPAESVSWQVWMRTLASTSSVTVRALARNAAGTVTGQVDQAATVTTTWTPFRVVVGAGALSALTYVVPEVVSGDGHTVELACPQLEYADFPSDWSPGSGVPRVTWPAASGRAVDVNMNSASVMTLAESILGAA